MNELYNIMNQNPVANMQSALMQIKQNPAAVLRQAGLNIPNGMNNPNQIVNYLLQSGQVNQSRLAQAQQMAARYRR